MFNLSPKLEQILWPLLAIGLFVAAFWLGPVQFSANFTKLPGDLGDARLNAYFLENAYQYFFGSIESLWHFGFFYPFPYVMGFSENLFGLVPIFSFFRLAGSDAYSSFQYLFMFGYGVNYLASLIVLRKLGISRWPAVLGALIFTFGFSVTARSNHAQLHYRFAMPFAIYYFVGFLKGRDVSSLVKSAFWLMWQFFVGIYLGFFTLVMLLSLTVCFLVFPYARNRAALGDAWSQLVSNLKALSSRQLTVYIGGLLSIGLALFVLFYPYLQVQKLYGFKRTWSDMLGLLPRAYSYIYTPSSKLWNFDLEVFRKLPVWYEHQLFPGMVPFVLFLVGMVAGMRRKSSFVFKLFSTSFIFLFCLTISTGGGWWEYVHHLPLFSAIRAVCRIDMLFLFVYAFVSAYFLDSVLKKKASTFVVCLLLSLFFVYESSQMITYWTPKDVWEKYDAHLEALMPSDLPENSVLFFAHTQGVEYEHETAAIWVALKNGFRTLNGYSGNSPRGYSGGYKKDCAELTRRIAAYRDFVTKKQIPPRDSQWIRRIVPVGFSNC